GARVVWSGVGRRLLTERRNARALRRAILELMSDPRYRQGSRRLGAVAPLQGLSDLRTLSTDSSDMGQPWMQRPVHASCEHLCGSSTNSISVKGVDLGQSVAVMRTSHMVSVTTVAALRWTASVSRVFREALIRIRCLGHDRYVARCERAGVPSTFWAAIRS